ncbi:MAG: response regulator [Planctomycetota bacterium]
MKILVIDDEEMIRESIKANLEFDGFTVETAEDGEAGLRLVKEFEPDLIICDIMMPRLSGYEVVRQLRSNPVTEAIPVIMLTAKGQMEAMRESMDLGADDFLTKPYTRASLLGAIKTRMKRASSISEKAQAKVEDFLLQVSSVIPHELRTPLASIIGYSEFIMSYYSTLSADELVDMAKTIHDAGTRLHDTIEKFILYSRLSIAVQSPAIAEGIKGGRASSSSVLSQVLKRVTWAADRMEDMIIHDEDTTFKMDEYHLYSVIDELLENAVKFSEKGTPVTLKFMSDEDYSAVEVRNYGRGMTSQQIEMIGAFRQFDRAAFEQQGLGLGLVIVKMLAELYDGDLDIVTKEDGETVVTFRVPA